MSHADFKALCTAKFERGRLAHPDNPWDKEHIDAIAEIKNELYDIHNYAELLADPNKKMKVRIYAEVMWNMLND